MPNHFWRLNAHPAGNEFADALSLESEEIPAPGPGEVLVRADWLSMDAGTRMWMTPRTDGYQPPLPLGSKMMGLCLGRVVASRHGEFSTGDLVRGFGQWAEFSLVTPGLSSLEKVDEDIDDIRQHFGALGMNAWTALVGLVEVAKAQPGETVLVSAAAGATGSLACQIAHNIGCRVIGIAGGQEKCDWLRDELGVSLAIDYRRENVEEMLTRAGAAVDVYFDNVGGPILDAVLPNMAHYGRIALCGLVSSYDRDTAAPGPARFDQILMRRLNIQGFFIPDFLDRSAHFMPRLRNWMADGRLFSRFDVTTGIENVLVAYDRMLSGKSLGKVIVDVRDPPRSIA